MFDKYKLKKHPDINIGWISNEQKNVTTRSVSGQEVFVFLGLLGQTTPIQKVGEFRTINIGDLEVIYCPLLESNEEIYMSSLVSFHEDKEFNKFYKSNSTTVDPKIGIDDLISDPPAQARYLLYGEVSQEKDESFHAPDPWKFHKSLWDHHILCASCNIVKTFVRHVSNCLTKSLPTIFPNIRRVKFGTIDTIGDGNHQITHCDNANVFSRPNDQLPCFVGHIPLSEEGLFLRIEEPTSLANDFVMESVKDGTIESTATFPAIRNVYYVHVPMKGALFIDDKTWHGGHYGSKGKKRFHMVVCPQTDSWSKNDDDDQLLMFERTVTYNVMEYNEKRGTNLKVTYPNYEVEPSLLKEMCELISAHEIKKQYDSMGTPKNCEGWDYEQYLLESLTWNMRRYSLLKR